MVVECKAVEAVLEVEVVAVLEELWKGVAEEAVLEEKGAEEEEEMILDPPLQAQIGQVEGQASGQLPPHPLHLPPQRMSLIHEKRGLVWMPQ